MTLGRYHAYVQGFGLQALCNLGALYSPRILSITLTDLSKAWELCDPDLAKIGRQLEAHTLDLAARFARHGALPYLVIHGETYAGNNLFDGDRIVGVVDYDKARWQPRVVELAEALITFASPRPGHLKHLVTPGFLDWGPFTFFLRSCARAAVPGENEVGALPEPIRCIWLSISLQRLLESWITNPARAIGTVASLLRYRRHRQSAAGPLDYKSSESNRHCCITVAIQAHRQSAAGPLDYKSSESNRHCCITVAIQAPQAIRRRTAGLQIQREQ